MAIIMNDSTERVAVLWDGATRGYEEITVQEPADVVVRLTGAADHAALFHFALEAITTFDSGRGAFQELVYPCGRQGSSVAPRAVS